MTPIDAALSLFFLLACSPSHTQVNVKFERFTIGPVSFRAPDGLRGELDTTYLDETMRISRGDRGNVFILLRESTERVEADDVWREWQATWA